MGIEQIVEAISSLNPQLQLALVGSCVFFPLFFMEIIWYRLKKKNYDWAETRASFGVWIGQIVSRMIFGGIILFTAFQIEKIALFKIEMSTFWHWVILFFAVDLSYYWFHRLSHEIRWLWASHCVHHSGTFMNFVAALRLGWTPVFSLGWLAYMPVILIGFEAMHVLGVLGVSLLYQYVLHTEMIYKFPKFIEYTLNTPSNHRVHHACNPRYLDRNHGGVLMIWDHIFGTYVEEVEEEPVKYGLVKDLNSKNPFYIAFQEWIHMWQDVKTDRSPKEVLLYLFGPPGWSHDGSRQTSEQARKAFHDRDQQKLAHDDEQQDFSRSA